MDSVILVTTVFKEQALQTPQMEPQEMYELLEDSVISDHLNQSVVNQELSMQTPLPLLKLNVLLVRPGSIVQEHLLVLKLEIVLLVTIVKQDLPSQQQLQQIKDIMQKLLLLNKLLAPLESIILFQDRVLVLIV